MTHSNASLKRLVTHPGKLKIGIVAPMVVKSATGLSNYIAELVPQLCDRGHSVTVLATDVAYRGAPADDIVPIDPRCTLHLFPIKGRVRRRLYYSAELAAWLRNNIAQFDVVDIQGLWFFSTVDAARACLAQGVPYVITPHGHMGKWDWSKRPLAKKIFFRALLGECWRRASAVRYLSRGEVSSSMVLPTQPPAIIPAAITLPPEADQDAVANFRARLGIAPTAPVVAFVGRVNPQKGVLELVQSFDFVRQRCPEAVLVVAGGLMPEYGEQVRAHAQSCDSSKNIHILGMVSQADKAALLASASVFVTLSRNEGMSSAILEALGQGVPAVCTVDSNIPEVLEYSAGVVTTLDPADAAAAIAGLLLDSERRQAMGRNARRMVAERFTWDSIIPQLVGLYERILVAPLEHRSGHRHVAAQETVATTSD